MTKNSDIKDGREETAPIKQPPASTGAFPVINDREWEELRKLLQELEEQEKK
ncbi:hypothetical protein HYZ99_00210 [Candidatus Peregrinibacteria bacterium]|nr:hypothetical protein [Candidatus Peregrinibacteria bacterium]